MKYHSMKHEPTCPELPRVRGGFTLTELLVVIVIIALLASITSMVVLSARATAKAAVVKAQMTQISMALDSYKQKYGEYPPDFSDTNAVMRHVQKRWPRYGVTNYAQFASHILWGSKLSMLVDQYKGNTSFSFSLNDATVISAWDFTNNTDFTNTNPLPCCYAAALVFWLGGLPDANGQPIGFFHNPKAPLGFDSSITTANGATGAWQNINLKPVQREDVFYTFPNNSIVTKGGIPAFNLDQKPIVYFRATGELFAANAAGVIGNFGAYALPYNSTTADNVAVAARTATKFYHFPNTTDYGVAAPYCRDTMGQWYGQESFQLVYPGSDGSFGDPTIVKVTVARAPGAQLNLSMQDNDNVTNFLEKGTTLESEFK